MIKIFDTTLRDGEQSPGCSMNLNEKITMARQLERLNVDIIEAGFAASSQGDFESVKRIADVIKNSAVCSLARCEKKDIDVAVEALKGAVAPRLHIFLATSPIHMQYKLKMTPDEVVEAAVEATKYARKFVGDVEFSPEDGSRSDRDFLVRVLEAVIDAGATVLNIPDTTGYATPETFADLIGFLKKNVRGIEKVDLSVHCHDDLGFAVANSLAAVRAGANQIECAVNGIGERAGNAALEEIVMALQTRKDVYGKSTRIVTTEIVPTSTLLQNITGVKVQPNKAIVGANAFAHEAGIHQHGVLANRETYEIMKPEDVGLSENQMVLGKHSGKHALKARLQSMGYHFEGEELEYYFKKFKDLADRKKTVYDQDIHALVLEEIAEMKAEYELDDFATIRKKDKQSMTIVSVLREGELIEKIGKGDGPIDAAFDALGQIMGKDIELADFTIRSVTEGKDALGETVVKLVHGENQFSGKGLSTDIIESSILAYINAVNHMAYFEERKAGNLDLGKI